MSRPIPRDAPVTSATRPFRSSMIMLHENEGHRMVPTHATKAGVRYRYYVSLPHLYGESKTASVGSISRIPAAEIEDIVVKSFNKHLVAQKGKPTSGVA